MQNAGSLRLYALGDNLLFASNNGSSLIIDRNTLTKKSDVTLKVEPDSNGYLSYDDFHIIASNDNMIAVQEGSAGSPKVTVINASTGATQSIPYSSFINSQSYDVQYGSLREGKFIGNKLYIGMDGEPDNSLCNDLKVSQQSGYTIDLSTMVGEKALCQASIQSISGISDEPYKPQSVVSIDDTFRLVQTTIGGNRVSLIVNGKSGQVYQSATRMIRPTSAILKNDDSIFMVSSSSRTIFKLDKASLK